MGVNGLVLYFVFYLLGVYGPHGWNTAVALLFYLTAVFCFIITCIQYTPLIVKAEDFLFCAGIAMTGVMLSYFTEHIDDYEFYHAVYILVFVALWVFLGIRTENRIRKCEKQETVS